MKMKADELITQRLAETSTYAKKGAYRGTDRSRVTDPETGPSALNVYAKKGAYKGTDRSRVMHPETGPNALNVYAKKGAYNYPSKSSIKKESY